MNRKEHLISLKRVRANSHLTQEEGGLYLDRNERSIPYPKEVMEEIGKRIALCPIHRYPDVFDLYHSLANWLGIKESELFITEGVSGAIKAILETASHKGQNVITPLPSFALYPVYGEMFELENRHYGYTDDYQFDLEKLHSLIDENTAAIFIPNPNVPIEGGLSLSEIDQLAQKLKETKTLLVIDEVYFPFGGPTCLPLIQKYENLLVMRSFSKAAGLAGIRVGYIAGNEQTIDYVSKMRTGYETNRLSIEVAKYFIENDSLILDYVEEVKESFQHLKSFLKSRQIEYTGGEWSNFIFINLKDQLKASQIVEDLKKQKIFVRGGWQAPFNTGFSVTGAPLNEYKRLIKALEELL